MRTILEEASESNNCKRPLSEGFRACIDILQTPEVLHEHTGDRLLVILQGAPSFRATRRYYGPNSINRDQDSELYISSSYGFSIVGFCRIRFVLNNV